MLIPSDYIQITGLSDSGTSDDSGTWNTSVDLSGITTVPAGATGVVVLIRNTRSSATWAGVRTSGKTTPEFMTDMTPNGAYTVVVDLNGGASLDFYQENSMAEFHITGWTDGDVTFYDIDGTPPEVPSTGSSMSTISVPSGVASGESLLLCAGRWEDTTRITDIGDPETDDDLGNDIYRGTLPVPVHNDQIRVTTGTTGQRVTASVAGGGFVKDWKNSVTVTANGTYQTPSQSNNSAACVIAVMNPGGTGWEWAWRRNGDAADLGVPGTSVGNYQPLITSVDANGEWQYRAANSDVNTELLVLGWGVDNSSSGPTIDSAPSTLARTTEGATIDVTSDDTSGHTVDLENSGGTTVESQTVTNIADNGDGTVTITFDVVPGSLTIGATDHVLRVTDSNGNDTETGITLRHPQITQRVEDLSGNAMPNESGIEWVTRANSVDAADDNGTGETTDGNGDMLILLPNTTAAPGDTREVQILTSAGNKAIADGTVA